MLNNEIDGNNIAVTVYNGNMLDISNTGAFVTKYNYIHNSGGDAIDFWGPASNAKKTHIIQYNVFANVGTKTGSSDNLQWANSAIVTNAEISFNTVYVNTQNAGPGNGLLTINSDGPTANDLTLWSAIIL